MKETIIGLAGHIDHGKTSLIKSLTNEFSGSLKEDLKRGMTIDLGIAFLDQNITLIDVPGHEDFVKNMISGTHGIDIGLLVIAADDGVMPQTIEHLNIFSILDISNLVIVINKIDLVDNDIIEVVRLEILELIEQTKFKNSNIINISTINNEGIHELKTLLINIVDNQSKKNNQGPFRLPVDRIFSIKGFGTVVTGTVISGSIRVGDELCIRPTNELFKVRGLNTHNSSTDKISIGQRAAINLQNIDKDKLKRGFEIVSKHFFSSAKSIIAKIKVLDQIDKPIKKNQRIRIHLNTLEVIGKIIFFNQKDIKPGEESIVLINFEKPMVACYKDKFIIRYYSPILTIGGGEVILSSDRKNNFTDNSVSMKLSKVSDLISRFKTVEQIYFLEIMISIFDKDPILLDNFCYRFGYSKSQLLELLKSYDNIIIINHLNKSWLLTVKQTRYLEDTIMNFMTDFFKNNSYAVNINKEIISNQLNIKSDFIDYLLFELNKQSKIKRKDGGWVLFKHQVSLSEEEEKIKNMILNILDKEGFNPSSIQELSKKNNINEKLILNIIKICESENSLIKINQNIFITSSNFLSLKTKLGIFFESNSSLTVPDFKNLFEVSRKYAIPILEYLDKIKFTYRSENDRKLLK